MPERGPASLPLIPEAVPEDYYSVGFEAEENLSCSELTGLLKSNQPSSWEEALQAIRKTKSKYLARTIYGFETKMTFDGATLTYPRAIVYGGDAKMILNFGGNKRHKGFERVEALCFNDSQNKFEFAEIVFPKEAPAPEVISDLTPEEKASKYVWIPGGRGVRECAKCHDHPARPIWDTYALWPGFYGGADDTLKDRERADGRVIYSSFELENWKRFSSGPALAGRYAFTSQTASRPNSDFSARLSYLNGRRIVGELKSLGEKFTALKYEFAHALFCSPKAERRYFHQLTGDPSVGTTLGVLPQNSDRETKEIFLSAYYHEMQKEKRLSAILGEYGLPSPLPKDRFAELRSYYRELFRSDELNLDLRLTRVDVDEVLMVRELKRVMDKVAVTIENWSMVRDGGFVHENGRGGEGRVALRLILEKPFSQEFLADDVELRNALTERQMKERKSKDLKAEDEKVCGLINRRLKPSL